MSTFSVLPGQQTSVSRCQSDLPRPVAVAFADGYARVRHRFRVTARHLQVPRRRQISRLFSPEASSVPQARRLTCAWLAAWGLDEQSTVAELLVSELVTNALCHAKGTIALTLSFRDGLLRCEVEDADPTPPRVRHVHEDDERGRGLHLLELLSCCWGSARTAEGKAVWFELPAQALSED